MLELIQNNPEIFYLIALLILLYTGTKLWICSALIISYIIGYIPIQTATVIITFLMILNVPLIRKLILSYPILKTLKALKFLPTISKTEKIAIEAGSVWMDAELFSGKPNIKKLLNQPLPKLTEEENSFIQGPLQQLCEITNDWEIHKNRQMPQQIWDKLKKEKFFGLIIPKEYGGLAFSAYAHSEIIKILATKSAPLSITAMVPNSLGPAELLIHYGTEKQKNHYLPKLASGEEIPCFALTEPGAGSDAGSMTSSGEIFKDETGTLKIKLNWNKRYITLAAISTLLGLAFKLRDPNHLLGKETELGITCALIPSTANGVIIGERHDPLGVPFYNCPTQGENVIIDINQIIGEEKGIGEGWKMLMECLAAGRGISLPATSCGNMALVTKVSSAYAKVREQFGLSIGKFEGIAEYLGKITSLTYMMEAARVYTCSGIDEGRKPPVITAIMKYYTTEINREIMNHGMDIVGGAGISKGPKNVFAHPYMAIPIGITVEGANILTRTLMIFGQGSIRCHPYVLNEIQGIEENNLKQFDNAFFKHIGHTIRNLTRYLFLAITAGKLTSTKSNNKAKKYLKKLIWCSAQFAFFADAVLLLLGGALKRKESITGRFSDILGWMYLITATIRYHQSNDTPETTQLLQWSCDYAFHQIQLAFEGIFQNITLFKPALWLIRLIPFSHYPKDSLTMNICQNILKPSEHRDNLTQAVFLSQDTESPLQKLEEAFKKLYETEKITKKIKQAIRKKKLKKDSPLNLYKQAKTKNIINEKEYQDLVNTQKMKEEIIQVDSFTQEAYLKNN